MTAGDCMNHTYFPWFTHIYHIWLYSIISHHASFLKICMIFGSSLSCVWNGTFWAFEPLVTSSIGFTPPWGGGAAAPLFSCRHPFCDDRFVPKQSHFNHICRWLDLCKFGILVSFTFAANKTYSDSLHSAPLLLLHIHLLICFSISAEETTSSEPASIFPSPEKGPHRKKDRH